MTRRHAGLLGTDGAVVTWNRGDTKALPMGGLFVWQGRTDVLQ